MIPVKKTVLLLSGLLAWSTSVSAQEYMFTYSKLYSQLKYNAEAAFSDVEAGIYFVDADTRKLCAIDKAWMEKEEHYEELAISETNQVLLPLDGNLKQANPLVFVQTPRDRRCDFSVVVKSRQPLEGRVSYQQAVEYLPQMQAMLENLGGMFASFFTPDVEGLTLEFGQQTGEVILSNGTRVAIENGKARILLADIAPDGYFDLPTATSRVLPWLPSAGK